MTTKTHSTTLRNFRRAYDGPPTPVPPEPQNDEDITAQLKRPELDCSEDSVLKAMGRGFEHMTGGDLLCYFMERFHRQFGYRYVTTANKVKEVKVMTLFVTRYGPETAGKIVALIFDKYAGELRGEVVGISHFSLGMKWIQDQLLHEVRGRGTRDMAHYRPLPDADDFIRAFSNI